MRIRIIHLLIQVLIRIRSMWLRALFLNWIVWKLISIELIINLKSNLKDFAQLGAIWKMFLMKIRRFVLAKLIIRSNRVKLRKIWVVKVVVLSIERDKINKKSRENQEEI